MKRSLTFIALTVSALSLANCASEPEVVHHYYHTNTRYVTKPSASVTTYSKSAAVGANSPEGFEAVTPPASYSR
jgi:hypothetical protein